MQVVPATKIINAAPNHHQQPGRPPGKRLKRSLYASDKGGL